MKKRIVICILCAALVLSLCGCQQNTPILKENPTLPVSDSKDPSGTSETSGQPSTYAPPMVAVAMPPVTQTQQAEDGTALFAQTYQDICLTLEDPQVAQSVTVDLMNRIDRTSSAAQAIRAEALDEYHGQEDWIMYEYQTLYRPVRLDQAVFSLLGSQISIAGSARPQHMPCSVTYDLAAGTALTLTDILLTAPDALCAPAEAALAASGTVLFDDYAQILADCLQGSDIRNWYLSESGLCLYFAPYEIGPYASGIVTAQIPYTSLVGILRDAYFPPEQPYVTGKMEVQPFDSAILANYHQFAELILSDQGNAILLTTDSAVTNLRLETQSGITVFAAPYLRSGDAVMIQSDFSASDSALYLTYTSEDQQLQMVLNGQSLSPA